MTQRNGLATAAHDALPQDGRSLPSAHGAETAAPSWYKALQEASAREQERLLALLKEQGILFSHQLPRCAPTSVDHATPLDQALRGGHATWSPLRAQPVEVADSELDPIQRDAVAKALQTPDLCLIQGPPDAGKRRVTAEIIRQAAARGERILLLAPRTSALDGLLEQIASLPTVLAVRCSSRDEGFDRLAPSIRRLTFGAQVATLKDQAFRQARQEAADAQERWEYCRRQESLWPQLQKLAEGQARLVEQLESLSRRKSSLPDIVAREAAEAEITAAGATSFQSCLMEALAPLRHALQAATQSLAELRTQIASLGNEEQERERRLALLRPLVEAKRSGRWWTVAWWRAVLSGQRLSEAAALGAEKLQAGTIRDKRDDEAARISQEHARLLELLRVEQLRRVAMETDRRRAELDQEEGTLVQYRNQLDVRWRDLCHALDAATPVAGNAESVRIAAETWHARLRQKEQCAEFARQWAAALEQEVGKMDARLRECANLIASTPRSLSTDEHFGDPSIRFDLLILIEAQDVADEDLMRVAGRANRLVLIGAAGSRPASGKGNNGRAPRLGLVQQLWSALHCDPRRLPYAWFREGERLCCRLRPISSSQRRWVEREAVADVPEIELGILAPPRQAPLLAEMVFPASYSIQQAKEYILRELQEWPISAGGSSIRWDEQPDCIVLRLAEEPLPYSTPMPLGAGVREMVGMPSQAFESLETSEADTGPLPAWQTCCIEFDRAAGWRRERAEQWVQEHLGLVDLGRTARLHPRKLAVPYLDGVVACSPALQVSGGGWA